MVVVSYFWAKSEMRRDPDWLSTHLYHFNQIEFILEQWIYLRWLHSRGGRQKRKPRSTPFTKPIDTEVFGRMYGRYSFLKSAEESSSSARLGFVMPVTLLLIQTIYSNLWTGLLAYLIKSFHEQHAETPMHEVHFVFHFSFSK